MNRKESLKDQYKILIGAYFGVDAMDEYDLKVYVLKEIDALITSFKETHNNVPFDYNKVNEEVSKLSLKRKLQDSLLVLYKMDDMMELIFMIKAKLKTLDSSC